MNKKHIAFAIALFASITLIGSFLYLKSTDRNPPKKETTQVQQRQTEDPLLKILGILEENSPNEMLKADFLTPELKKFSQQKSASLQSCIQSVSTENIVKGKVNAFYNPNGDISSWQNADGTINKTKLRGELAPVFGLAVNTSALNWTYDEKYFQYTFLMPEGDESLWYCYFTQEPFFRAFFKEISFQMDLSTTPVPTVSSMPTIAPIATPTQTATPELTPTPLPCDRKTGGEGCFGQTWDGRWWTLEEEKAGKVGDLIYDGIDESVYEKMVGVHMVEENGNRRPIKLLSLFVPSKAYFLKPTDPTRRPIMIFSSPGGAETFWGCGREPNIIASTKMPVNPELIIGYNPRTKLDMSGKLVTCDFSQSLRGDVTYMMRLPVKNGRLIRTNVMRGMYPEIHDEWGAWFSALSFSPDTTIGYNITPNTPTGITLTGEPEGCLTTGSAANYNPYNCQHLNKTVTKYSEYTILYLKLQAAPSNGFSNGVWTGIRSSQCGFSLKCRQYVVAW